MPFASKLQLQTCFSKNLSILAQGKVPKWNCKKWLQETKYPQCLPTLSGQSAPKNCKKRKLKEENLYDTEENRKKSSADEWTRFYRGARGGLYFFAAGLKLYVPEDAKEYVETHFQVSQQSKK